MDFQTNNDMEKVNLFWAVVWSVMAVLCFVARVVALEVADHTKAE